MAPLQSNPSRRDVLKRSAAAGAALVVPYFFSTPRSFGEELASDKVNIGLIGAGGMGRGNLRSVKEWINLVAVADVDSRHCEGAKQEFGGKADTYSDYRKILDRSDINVLHIATPDHWHAKPLIEAMLAGKDVYCEKPLTLTIDEGKLIRKVQKETGRIVQVGTQQRSTFDLFVKAMALVAEGRVGKIQKIEARIDGAPSSPAIPVVSPPAEFDWERWLGPAPEVEYRFLHRERSEDNPWGTHYTNGHYTFRWWYEFSGGKLTDWGAHHVDIAA
ncbi:MAG: Gfo/Idh/MocA family oxidoreductase, partial [Planctomycetota bacterium]